MDQGSSCGTGDGLKLQLKAYAKVDFEQLKIIPVMLNITAKSGTADRKALSPVDVVIVLNVREKGAKRQKILVEAVKVVAEKLDNEAYDSRLAIVGGQSTLLPMTARSSRVEVATKAVMLYYPISSYTYTSMVRALGSAEKILYGRKEEDKSRREGHIIIISDSKDDPSSLLTWRFPCVHAFGFRDEHNARIMHAIATNPGCTYAILDDENGCITMALASTIDRITSTVAIKVKLKWNESVTDAAIDTPHINYLLSDEEKAGTIFTSTHLGGAVQAPVVTNFVMYLSDRFFFMVQLTKIRELVSEMFTSLHMEYDGGDKKNVDVETVTKGMDGSKQLAAEMVRIKAFQMIADIISIADDKNLYVAADELRQRWTMLENSDSGREAGHQAISGIAREMREMETRLYNNYLWLEYMLSWQSHQQWQLPLPPLFMDKQPGGTGDHLLQPEIFAALPETVPESGLALPLPVLVRLAARKSGLAKVKRASVDLVVVIDAACGSTQLLVKAMDHLVKKLGDKDRLALMHVQSASSATQLLAPSRLQEMWSNVGQGADDKADKVNKLDAISSSFPELLQPRTKLTTELKDAIKILDGRGEEKDRRPGFVIVISDSEDESICQETLVSPYITHAFGFHNSGMGNTRAMKYIARSSKDGIYGVLNDNHDEIAKEFSSCIDQIISTIAMGMTVHIDITSNSKQYFSHAVLSSRLWSSISSDRKSGSIFAGAIHAGSTKGFIIYVENIGNVFNYYNLSELLTVHVKWLNASTSEEEGVDGGRLVVVRQEELDKMLRQLLLEHDSKNPRDAAIVIPSRPKTDVRQRSSPHI